MVYPQNFEDKTGFTQIRQRIAAACLSSLGVEETERMHFSYDYDEIRLWLSYGEEFSQILQLEPQFPEMLFFDMRSQLERIRVEGTWLDEKQLFDLKRSLESLQRMVRFFLRRHEEEAEGRISKRNQSGSPEAEDIQRYPSFTAAASQTAIFPDIVEEINHILDPFGNIQDHASTSLANIRKQLSITTAGISRRLHILLKQAQDEGFVEKGLSPSLRDGRLVIPVTPAFKKKIKGIVHDESATGKTVYIEPEEIVEANNRVRELESEEKREIVHILTELTGRIRPKAEEMIESQHFLALIDFSQAKARFAHETHAICPQMTDKTEMKFDKAVHPLLFLSLQKQGKQVVPLDIRLDSKNRIILISGPNAGGKSVCLKTAGLLQYMLQCGLPIPVCESSVAGIFRQIFIDIGDEQSIENDLSTYSSHLLNIKYFVRNADRKTLLLIDEFGSGTEPKIGGAIAQAALQCLNQKRTFGIITTHYDNLKHFAEDQEGIVNGAMLYDRHLMQALFRLEIGHPGSSFAIEIARKIGLPEEIIQQASELVGSEYIDMDKHLQDIMRDKRYWENKRQQVKQLEKTLEKLTTQYEEQLGQVRAERKDILKTAKQQARQLLDDTNAQIENTIRGIKEAQAEKEKTRELRQGLDEFKQQALAEEDEKAEARLEARRQRDKGRNRPPKTQEEKILQKIRRQQGKNQPSGHTSAKPEMVWAVGDTVHIQGQDSIGTIAEIKGSKALVTFGSIQTRVALGQLEKGKAPKEDRNAQNHFQLLGGRTADEVHRINQRFQPEIDMRGMRADEAMTTLQYYIDDAIVVGAAKVRILHGTGTGALRQLVREYLATQPQVVHFHDEHVQLGGSGITVVEFK